MDSLRTKICDVVSLALNKHPKIFVDIFLSWHKILEQDIISLATPIGIIEMKDNVFLKIGVNSASTKVEISFQKKMIIDKICSFFGSKVVDDIKILVL